MNNTIIDKTIPLKSMLLRPETEQQKLLEDSFELPKSVRLMIISPNTGSYVRGLTKHHQIPEGTTPKVAFAILQIALGIKQLSQLASMLSSEIQVSNEKAQKMAQEIEKDLFSPIMPELESYLAKKKKNSKPQSPTEGMDNVVNLKDNPQPNKPFPLPPKQ